MNILAIDQASLSGWALLYDGELSSGTIPLSRPRKDTGPGHRMLEFQRELEERFGEIENKTLTVVHEQPFVSQQLAAVVLVCGMAMHVEAWAHRHQHRCLKAHNARVKKHATGNGFATKEQMLRNARLKWPDQDILDHNQADALWIMDWARYGEQ